MKKFNKGAENKTMKEEFSSGAYILPFYNLMKQNICFKGDRGSCIDLLIINSRFSFMKTSSFETGLSDHHHMTYIYIYIYVYIYIYIYIKIQILKTKFEKFEPKKLIYHNFKQLDSDQFKLENPSSR